jgi:MFS family permease
MRASLSLLRQYPGFRRIWAGALVSQLGDWLSYVALSRFSLTEGGGVASLAWIFVAHSFPYVLLAPLGGVLADRLDRSLLLRWVPLVQGALTVAMVPAALFGGAFWVGALVFVRAALVALYEPAETAAMRRVVPAESLLAAYSLNGATWSVMFALGMALGGVISLLGLVPALLLDAASFFLASWLVARVPPMPPAESLADTSWRALLARSWSDLAEAWRYAWVRPGLREALLSKTPLGLLSGAAFLTLNLKADSLAGLGSGALLLGALQAVKGAGTGAGPLVAARLSARGWDALWLSRAASVLTLVCVAWFRSSSLVSVALLAALFWGVGSGSNWMLSTNEIQRRAPDAVSGRLVALDSMCLLAGQCLSVLLGALAEGAAPGQDASALVGVALGSAGLVSLWAWGERRERAAHAV